ncbi:MAG: hypothetical protein ACK5TO_13430 [Planctomycetaceae bacterium]|jgi:hypothetical protein
MPRLSRRMFAFLWLILGALILLAALSPGYVRVRMTGTPDGDIDVEQVGFGPKKVRVQAGDGVIESRAW